MSDLKRKYDGLKQAHAELSVEVVALREKVEELEGDIKTSNEILRMADKFVGIVVRERDTFKRMLDTTKDLLTLIRTICNPEKELDDMIAFMQKRITNSLKEADNG